MTKHFRTTKLQINHPLPNSDAVHAVEYTDKFGHLCWCVVAHGAAHGIDAVTAVLITKNAAGEIYTYYGPQILKHRNWVCVFTELPACPADAVLDCVLVVVPNDEAVSIEPHAATVHFQLRGPSRKPKLDSGAGNIPISCPMTDSLVSSTFTAWGQNGSGTSGAPTRASMVGNLGNTYWGNLVPAGSANGPPLGSWMFNFSGLVDDEYEFNIDNDPNPTPAGLQSDPFPMNSPPSNYVIGQTSNITVDSANAGPDPLPPPAS